VVLYLDGCCGGIVLRWCGSIVFGCVLLCMCNGVLFSVCPVVFVCVLWCIVWVCVTYNNHSIIWDSIICKPQLFNIICLYSKSRNTPCGVPRYFG